MLLLRSIALFVSLTILSACSYTHKPVRTYDSLPPKPPVLSNVRVTTNLSHAEIEATIRSQLKREHFGGRSNVDCNVLRAAVEGLAGLTKEVLGKEAGKIVGSLGGAASDIAGAIKDLVSDGGCFVEYDGWVEMAEFDVRESGGNLQVFVRLKAHASVELWRWEDPKLFGGRKDFFILSETTNPDTQGDFLINLDANLTDTYGIVPVVDIQFQKWHVRPSVKIFFDLFKVTFASNIEGKMKDKLRALEGDLASDIVRDFDIKNDVSDAWNLAHDPIQLDEENNIWLKVRPLNVLSSGLNSTVSDATTDLMIEVETEAQVGTKPAAHNPAGLPLLKQLVDDDSKFKLSIPVDIPYSELESKFHSQLADTSINTDFGEIKLRDFRIFQTESTKTAIGVKLTAKPKWFLPSTGWLYVYGDIVTDGDSIELLNADYTAGFNNPFYVFAHWVFKPKIKKEIISNLKVSLAKEVTELKTSVSSNVFDLSNTIKGSISLDEIGLSSGAAGPHSLKTQVEAVGNAVFEVGL